MYGKPVNLVRKSGATKTVSNYAIFIASSSIVVCSRGIGGQGTLSEAKATCLDSTDGKAQNSTRERAW